MVHHTQLLNRLVRDKRLIPVTSVDQEVTYHDPCFLGRHNKEYEAPRELVGAAGAKLTEMPRHADRGLCCGAGGARMWMEEHIGKRVNTERTEEAIDTGASAIATGCPFCRVMITDGVDDVAATREIEKVEVLDVAQLLLSSLDTSLYTLPEKGTAAAESAKRAEAREAAEAKVAAAAPVVEEAEEAPAAPAAAAAPAAPAAPVKGLGLAGGAKRPGAKKAAPAAADAPRRGRRTGDTCCPGQGTRAGRRRQAPRRQEGRARRCRGRPRPRRPATEAAAPAAPVKGLGLAAGAKRPGAKKAAPASPNQGEPTAAPAAERRSRSGGRRRQGRDRRLRYGPAEPAQAEPPVVGLGIAAGARRPGAKKAAPKASAPAAPAAPAAAAEPVSSATEPPSTAVEPEPAAEPASSSNGSGEDRVVGDEPPVKGLGIAKGARRPGKR